MEVKEQLDIVAVVEEMRRDENPAQYTPLLKENRQFTKFVLNIAGIVPPPETFTAVTPFVNNSPENNTGASVDSAIVRSIIP